MCKHQLQLRLLLYKLFLKGPRSTLWGAEHTVPRGYWSDIWGSACIGQEASFCAGKVRLPLTFPSTEMPDVRERTASERWCCRTLLALPTQLIITTCSFQSGGSIQPCLLLLWASRWCQQSLQVAFWGRNLYSCPRIEADSPSRLLCRYLKGMSNRGTICAASSKMLHQLHGGLPLSWILTSFRKILALIACYFYIERILYGLG